MNLRGKDGWKNGTAARTKGAPVLFSQRAPLRSPGAPLESGPMSGPTQLRLASLSAFAYGALAISGAVHHLQRSGSLRLFVHDLTRPSLWLVALVAFVLTWGLWNRYAWAWWLGVAAGCWEIYVIASRYVHSRAFGHVPAPAVLLALGLVLCMVVLLFQRRARASASR